MKTFLSFCDRNGIPYEQPSLQPHNIQHRSICLHGEENGRPYKASVTLLDNCIMIWGSGLEDGNKHHRENLPFIIAGKGGGSVNTGKFLPDIKGNQGDLLTTLVACAGLPLNRPIGIATKQITEIKV